MPSKRYDFIRWLQEARRGESKVYHVGLLMADRQDHKVNRYKPWDEIHAIATTAWRAYEEKVCFLVQRRSPCGGCEYIAVKL